MRVEAAVAAIAIIAVAFFAGFQANSLSQPAGRTVFLEASAVPQASETVEITEGETRVMSIDVPAVDRNDNGVLARLNVEARRGAGRVYIDYSQKAPLLGSETQNSILTAVEVAKKTTGKQLKATNLYFSLSTDAQEVGGSSAGGSVAVATAALLSGRKIKKGFIMTGTVDENGRIGKVGRILEKAQAAKKAGYTTFLVPPGESKIDVAVEKCIEKRVGNALIKNCSTEFYEKNVEDEAGIRIIEVGEFKQAFALMTE
ncbi:MAG: S16 family serine protease [Candidatus Norongarragalinales archaeon]